MVLDKLGKSLRGALERLTKSSVDIKSIKELARDIKRALIEADTDIQLAKSISERIKKRSLAEKAVGSVTAKEHTINIVYEELIKFLGKEYEEIKIKKQTKIMLVGLFGAGKTTTAGKLAKFYKDEKKKVALLQTDTWRPAAYEQLEQLAKQIKVPFFGEKKEKNPKKIYKKYKDKLKKFDVIIIDTAGRDALNKELIDEIASLHSEIKPKEKLLVISGDIGQTAQSQAQKFHDTVGVTGVIVTKLDGTAKGGGALTACSATKAKVKFIGTGEKITDLEKFRPKNFVSLLLGMGDLESLLEKVEKVVDKEKAEKTAKKMIKGDFTLEDLFEQMDSMSKMGGLSQITSMLPGLGAKIPKGALKKQSKAMESWKFAMQSMTKEEKAHPELIKAARIKRIAAGSGRSEHEVRDLLAKYKKMKKMMKAMGSGMGKMTGGASMKQLKKLLKQGGL
tara:strand:- start:191 stop:1540 length:1350 start_codon:yes stop_codon:yes gene_type:complete